MNKSGLQKLIYFAILLSVSSLILATYLRPVEEVYRAGINQYYRSMYLDMVNGKAYKPYVYRTLLPTTVRIISSIVPAQYQKICAQLVEQNSALGKVFDLYKWEKEAAFQYLVGFFLMLLAFMGFGHYVAMLLLQVCNLPKTIFVRSLLAILALMGIPPFFRYTAFPYDPPQLFLFTFAIHLLVSQRTGAFVWVYIACCFNKETAILLVPLYALRLQDQNLSRQQYWLKVLCLVVIYAGIKTYLSWIFHENPGTFVEIQLVYNILLLTTGWTFTNIVVFSILMTLIFFHWSSKPYFVRTAFLLVLLPQVALGVISGYLDEWRVYFEAYPLALALVTHSVLEINKVFTSKNEGEKAPDTI